MSKKRRSYGHEFKVEALRLVTKEGYTMAEAGRSLGISPNLLTRWKHTQNDAAPALIPERTIPLRHAVARSLSTPNLRQSRIILSVFPPPT